MNETLKEQLKNIDTYDFLSIIKELVDDKLNNTDTQPSIKDLMVDIHSGSNYYESELLQVHYALREIS